MWSDSVDRYLHHNTPNVAQSSPLIDEEAFHFYRMDHRGDTVREDESEWGATSETRF